MADAINTGRYVIHENNLEEFLRLFKKVLDKNYVTSNEFNLKLEEYAKKSDIEGLIPEYYITQTKLDDFHNTLLNEVDYKIQNFEAVKGMTQDEIDNAINSVLY